MIFLAVGTQKFQFNRLLKAVDDCVSNGIITDDIFAQIGESDYVPQNYAFERFLSKDVFDEKIKQCDLVITHGGVATIMQALQAEKPVIVVPRMARYGEHVDDHQVEITKTFAKAEYVVPCYDSNELVDAVKQARQTKKSKYVSHRGEIVAEIEWYIEQNCC